MARRQFLNGLSILFFSMSILTAEYCAVHPISAIIPYAYSTTLDNFSEDNSKFNVKIIAPKDGVYHGANPGFGGTEDQVTTEIISNYDKVSGKKIAWAYFSNNWDDDIKFPEEAVRTIDNLDIVPFIRMMPRSDFNQGDSDPVYTLQAIIDGNFDDSLIEWAKDAKRTNIPLMIEFGTEVNGDWFPWSGIFNGGGETDEYGDPEIADGPERFRDAYRHIIDLFRNEGANNITWVFHVIPSFEADDTSSSQEAWNNVTNYYPGHDYIDWIGTSVYGSTEPGKEWKAFADIMDTAYKELESISTTKPFAILELGIIEDPEMGNKSEWLENALQLVKDESYPRIKAISYWNEKWEHGDNTIDLTINSSMESEEVYKRLISSPFFKSTANYEFNEV